MDGYAIGQEERSKWLFDDFGLYFFFFFYFIYFFFFYFIFFFSSSLED